MLIYHSQFGDEKVTLHLHKYQNENLAIQMICHDEDGFEEPYAMMTKNFVKLKPNMAFVDVNNLPEVIPFITNNNLGKIMSTRFTSGYCIYPLVEFNMEEVKKHEI